MFNPQNTRVSHQRPRGFTLVELLVVIVIISILAALITPAVIGALESARRATISQEITAIDAALKTYKTNFGSYPPSNGIEFKAHLSRKFIYAQTTPTPAQISATYLPDTLKGAEIMVYCLGGYQSISGSQNITFSTDKRLPITGTTKQPALYDFDQSRLVTFPGTGSPTYTNPSTVNTAASPYTFPVYVPPYPSTKTTPYAYFCTSRATSAAEFYTVPTLTTATTGLYGIARPYVVDLAGTGTGLALANNTSFQIICAGLDGNMGNDEAATPMETTFNPTTPPGIHKYFKANSTGPVYYHDNNEQDNLTNFYTNRLEDNKP